MGYVVNLCSPYGLLFFDAFKKCHFLFNFKEDEKFNRPSTISQTYGAGKNIYNILGIDFLV